MDKKEVKKTEEKKEKIDTKLHQIRLPIKLLDLFEDLAIRRGVTLNDYIKFTMLEKVEESEK